MTKADIHLFPGRGLNSTTPLVLPLDVWTAIVQAAEANGSTGQDAFSPRAAMHFAAAIRRAMGATPAAQRPGPSRPHVPTAADLSGTSGQALTTARQRTADLTQASSSGLLDQVLALLDAGDGVTVVRATSRELREGRGRRWAGAEAEVGRGGQAI